MAFTPCAPGWPAKIRRRSQSGGAPTVEGETGELLLEAHLFGHPGNIYGREMEVEPVRFLRPEIKFPSLEELKSQLARDAAHAAEALEEGE